MQMCKYATNLTDVYSGRFTHASSHPSAVGRAQDKESSLVKEQRSTTMQRNQLPATKRVFLAQNIAHAFAAGALPAQTSCAAAAAILKIDITYFC